MRRTGAAIATGVLALLAGCGSDATVADGAPADGGPGDPTPASTAAPDLPPLPDGWRWESYRDVVVGVPGEWRHATGAVTSPCARDGDTRPPAVRRSGGYTTGEGCDEPRKGEPNLGAKTRHGGTYVALLSAGAPARSEGDRTVVRLGAAVVVVQASRVLREDIVATVRQVASADHHGCPVRHAITADPAARPDPAGAIEPEDVQSIAACRYDLAESGLNDTPIDGPSLVSSVLLDGDVARSALAGVIAAPDGGGPDEPASSCHPSVRDGEEAIVLRLAPAGGAPAEIVMRYAGCNHNGFDDGVRVRTLTTEAVRPFIGGANGPNLSTASLAKLEVMFPEEVDEGLREKFRINGDA